MTDRKQITPPEPLTAIDNGGWNRQFPAEKAGITSSLFSFLPFLKRPTYIMGERQAQFFDTSFYFRIGGLDPEKVAEHADALIIQAGIGSRMADTLPEHVAIAKATGKPYGTYLIPDVSDRYSVTGQVDAWVDWPGVKEAPMFSDIEKPRATTRHVNASEFKAVQNRMKSVSDFQTWSYSRVNIFEVIFPYGFPAWMSDVNQWIAQYFLDSNGAQYRYFEDWLNVWAWKLPPSVTRSVLYQASEWRNRVKAWQISSKFDGEYYLAPEWISPGQPGIKSVDGNVSIESEETFYSYFPDPETEPPIEPPIDPPDPNPVLFSDRFETLFKDQNFRVEPSTVGGGTTVIKKLPAGAVLTATPCPTEEKPYTGVKTYIIGMSNPKEIWLHGKDETGQAGWLAAYHPSRTSVFVKSIEPLETEVEPDPEPDPDPPPDPEPPPEENTKLVTVREGDKAPAFAYERTNNGKPIMDINVYMETLDPALKWVDNGEEIRVVSQAIEADGGIKWYILREDVNKYGYPELYIRKDVTRVVE